MQVPIQVEALAESRIQLHYAVQFIAAVGAALAEPQLDSSHTTLSWNPEKQLFEGVLIGTEHPFRVALDPVNLILTVLDPVGAAIAQTPLHQKTLADGMTWLKSEIARQGADAEKVVFLAYPADDFPDHGIAHGAPFDHQDAESRQRLTTYYQDTQALLGAIVPQLEGSSPIYIWPHHFDMATLVSLPGKKDGEATSIGIGFSPGDTSYTEPYWYVSPYPYPDPAQLPPLEGNGFWHVNHWVGAVLTASQQSSIDQLNSFLNSAINLSLQWLQAQD